MTAEEHQGPRVDYSRAFNQLCHLVALNRTDQVEGAIDKLVLTTLVVAQPHNIRSPRELTSAVFVLFGAQLDEERVRTSVDTHLEAGAVVRDTGGVLVPSPGTAARVQQRIDDARRLEQAVKDEWLRQIAASADAAPLDSEALWKCLQLYMALAFRRHGAETVVLLSPSAAARKLPGGALANYMNAAIDRTGLRESAKAAAAAVNEFFTDPTADRSKYVSQLLDGTFTFFALTLDEETSDYLKGSIDPLTVLLDTNFIFGLLGLHDNYLVKGSKELVRFIRDNEIPFRLYYHEYTLKEIERTLDAQANQLRARRWQQSLSRAAVAAGAGVGLERVYHALNSEQPIDVDAFLAKYENPARLLKALGLEIYREAGKSRYSTEEKGFVVADYKDFVDRYAHHERSYHAVDHDASVWLALTHLRKQGVPTLRSGFIFLTNDYWLHLWDKRNRLKMATPGGVVLPTQLLQVLRPLVPATDDFDRRFGETFALPEFRTAQSGYARTSSKVLSYLATFKDMPELLALSVLRDHALAARLQRESPESREFREAIENRLVEENRELLSQRVELESRIGALEERQQVDSEAPADTAEFQRLHDEAAAQRDRATVAENELSRRQAAERHVAFALLSIVLGAFAWMAPEWFSLPWSDSHPRRDNLGIATTVIATGISWIATQKHHRLWALGVAVLGGVFAIVQVM